MTMFRSSSDDESNEDNDEETEINKWKKDQVFKIKIFVIKNCFKINFYFSKGC